MYNTKNYKKQGGDEWVVGGKLTIEDGASVAGLPQAANVAAVTPAGAEPTAVEATLNALLEALKDAGLMAADTEE